MALDKLIRLASNRGGTCLSAGWLGYRKKHRWRCSAGHEFEATPEQIPDWVEWCAECRGTGGSFGERLCRAVLERMFCTAMRRRRPEWLSVGLNGARLELDGYAEAERIAFEYNGPQHYGVVHGLRYTAVRVEEQRQRDEAKARLCRERGVRLIVVPEFTDMGSLTGCLDQVEYAVLWAGLAIPREWKRPSGLPELWSPLERLFGAAGLADLRRIAAERGGVLVSGTASFATDPLMWRCASGHTFSMIAWNVQAQGAWCKHCKRDARTKPLRAMLPKPWFAVDAGGGDHPERRCARGHTFRLKVKKDRGPDWCPACRVEDNVAKMKLEAAERCRRVATARGGRFSDQEYRGGEERHAWVCRDGHDFVALPSRVVRGKWCPTCPKENWSVPVVCEAMAAE